MPGTIQAALLFLVNTLFDLYLFILVLRIILVYVGAHFFDPVTQFVSKTTDFLVKPLRRVIPNRSGFELASILLVLMLEMIKFLLISLIMFGSPAILGVLILAIGDAFKIVLLTFFYAIILQVILSWVQPMSPISRTLYQITSPVMRPFHRLIPPVAGFDISPIPALIILQLLIILFISPLLSLGLALSLR